MDDGGVNPDPPVDPLAERLADVRRAIDRVERAWTHHVGILAVTKGFGPEVIERAVAAGCDEIGENYAQDLLAKRDTIERLGPRVHFIGHLQSNKVRQLSGLVDVWASLDRGSIIDEVSRRSPGATVLIQVNSTGEPGKSGCQPAGARDLVSHATTSGLNVAGLMTIGPTSGDAVATADAFRLTRSLVDDLGLSVCSMGMSGDLELAVAHGSTQVRIGTALFGERPT
jgi:pyridoxal phosphate enzyme (YggS family)